MYFVNSRIPKCEKELAKEHLELIKKIKGEWFQDTNKGVKI